MLFIAVLLQIYFLQQCFLFFIVVVILGHKLGNSQVSVYRTIGPTLVLATLFGKAFFKFESDSLWAPKFLKNLHFAYAYNESSDQPAH